MKKTLAFLALNIALLASAQFRTKDRVDHLEGADERTFSYGFFLNASQNDYKMVLNPQYGTDQNKNLVTSKPTYSFGAGLIGRMRINPNFDLRLEPGMQFIERDLYFDTQVNDHFATTAQPPFTPKPLTEEDKVRKIKATTIDIPLLLEFHIDRWYNSRPYAAAGVNWLVNLQSNAGVEEDNANGTFRSTTHNFGYSAEIGIQFYFGRFKLTPAFRGTFTMNNELVSDNKGTPPYWASALNTIQGRSFMFILKFE
ncbi:porin family protein [Riemerella columbina]|uniref:type IX secretion/gliding motility protein PorT/SprT n=1 Tax=Riemerella columbina TaxID=103810 RepID=UPI00266F06D9|nr:porin family protein [Riemerella columbina]WKS94568.1 PorT family protein [Riemerella columbina]